MKWFLLLIITLNLAIFAYEKISHQQKNNKPRISLNAEKIQILPANWSKPEPSTNAASAPAKVIEKQSKKNILGKECFKWGPLKQHLITRIQGGLPELKLSDTQIKITEQQNNKNETSYLIYLPVPSNEDEYKNLANNLASNGLNNVPINENGEKILSLGIFKEKNNAQNILRKAIDAGFDQATMKINNDQKTSIDKENESVIYLSKLTKEQASILNKLQRKLTPGIPTKKASCNKTNKF